MTQPEYHDKKLATTQHVRPPRTPALKTRPRRVFPPIPLVAINRILPSFSCVPACRRPWRLQREHGRCPARSRTSATHQSHTRRVNTLASVSFCGLWLRRRFWWHYEARAHLLVDLVDMAGVPPRSPTDNSTAAPLSASPELPRPRPPQPPLPPPFAGGRRRHQRRDTRRPARRKRPP